MLRKKDDTGFTTVMKPLKSFTCNQTKTETEDPHDYYINHQDQLHLFINSLFGSNEKD